jgi:uncharacterized protein (TIGR00725 family)
MSEIKRYVAVIGPGDEATAEEKDMARSIGRRLAERGIVIVNGGLGGVMEAASEGAALAKGVSIGLLPGRNRDEANHYVNVAIPTGMGELRNGLVVGSADAVVAIGGSWGTLSEIALAKRTGKPVVCVRGWHVTTHKGVGMDIDYADTPQRAIEWVLAVLQANQ